MVTASGEHGGFGWLRLLTGISSTPKRIRYQCRRCDQVFAESTDAEDLRKYY
jgi:hypothetical protein